VVKIGYGMLSDRVNLLGMGHRKPYILIGLAVQIGCLIVAPFVDPGTRYWGFVALAFILQMGMALYDTCTDGLALDTVPEPEQGPIQGIMVGGRALGVVVTASAVGLLAQEVSWLAVFWLLALFTLLPIPLVLGVREAPRPVERTFQWGAFAAFRRRTVVAIAALGFVFFLIIAGVNQNVNPFLEETFDIPLSTAGLLTTVWGLGTVLGGAVGGSLIRRFGQRAAVWVTLALALVSILTLAVTGSLALAWPVVILFGLAYGTCQAVYYSLAMNATDARIAASMFSILMAAVNVAQGAGMALSGLLADKIGFRWTFAVFAALNLLVVPIAPVAFSTQADQDQPA
jgi:PAT family beta-lactamase induction signal transducer AmpG